nr:hypothetical protein [Tanacetum cinerariifolium]
ELTLLCGRMFLGESDKIQKYVGGLPDMIHQSVMASKLKTMHDAVESAIKLMDKKIRTYAERQIKKKGRKMITNSNKTRGIILAGPTQLGLVRKGSMVDLCQNVPSATTIIMVHVHRSATSAIRRESQSILYILNEKGGPKEDECIMSYQYQWVSVWEGAEVVHLQAGVFK